MYDNLIVMCEQCHVQHNQGKEPDTAAIKERKRHLIRKTLTRYGVNALKMAARRRIGVVGFPYMLHHLVELRYLAEEEPQMGYSVGDDYLDVTVRFTITPSGKRLEADWLRWD